MAASLLGGPSRCPTTAGSDLRGAAALAAAPCPSADQHRNADGQPGPGSRRPASARFDVFGPKPTELAAPIDWHTDPLDAERYRQNLHKLRFLDPLLASYAYTATTRTSRRRPRSLSTGSATTRSRSPDTPAEAWPTRWSATGRRIIAYLLRAAACEGLLEPRRAARAARLARSSTAACWRRSATTRADNHGLFVDLGLARLTSFLPFLDAVAEVAGAGPRPVRAAPCAGGSRRASGSSTPRPTSSSRSGRSTRCSTCSAPTPSSRRAARQDARCRRLVRAP